MKSRGVDDALRPLALYYVAHPRGIANIKLLVRDRDDFVVSLVARCRQNFLAELPTRADEQNFHDSEDSMRASSSWLLVLFGDALQQALLC